MKYSDEQIADAVKVSDSWAKVYRVLTGTEATKTSPGMQSHFKRRADKAGINYSHFRYQRKAVTEEAVPVVAGEELVTPPSEVVDVSIPPQ